MSQFAEERATTSTRAPEGGTAYVSPWLPGSLLDTSSSARRVFCFPYAGGVASAFRPWTSLGGSSLQMCPVQYPGRESRWGDAGFDTLGDLVDALVTDLHNWWRGTFSLWGHSFGALVALEVTRRLAERGLPTPRQLIVSAAPAPQLPRRKRIHSLPDAEFLCKLTAYGGMADEVLHSADLLKALLPVIRHDFRLFETYAGASSSAPIDVSIAAYGGASDANVDISDVLAWASITTRTFRSRFFDGDHFFPFRAVDEMWRALKEDLVFTADAEGAAASDSGSARSWGGA